MHLREHILRVYNNNFKLAIDKQKNKKKRICLNVKKFDNIMFGAYFFNDDYIVKIIFKTLYLNSKY